MTRREVLRRLAGLSAASMFGGLVGCDEGLAKVADLVGQKELANTLRQEYKIAPRLLRLGEVKDLLFPVQKLNNSSIVLFREEKGWSALSARCSREGCDLSFTGNTLFCPCCRSRWNIEGRRLRGKAKHNLPWYQVGFRDELRKVYLQSKGLSNDIRPFDLASVGKPRLLRLNLYVHTGLPVASDHHFHRERLEEIVAPIIDRISENEERLYQGVPEVIFDPPSREGYWYNTPLTDDQLDAKYDIRTFERKLERTKQRLQMGDEKFDALEQEKLQTEELQTENPEKRRLLRIE